MRSGKSILFVFLILLFVSGFERISSDCLILVPGTKYNFGTYTAEILRAEGFREFIVNSLTDKKLDPDHFNVVISGETPVNQSAEQAGWFAGDIHVHRSCNGSKALPADELKAMMEVNDLRVISVLSDMGNSEAEDRVEDLKNVNGKDSPLSGIGRTIHYAAEWHWDANEWDRPHQALGGHLVLLGLSEAHKIWDESPYKIIESVRKQGAICGFAHMQYFNNQIPEELNCCIPIDFPVEAALGTIDFISEDCDGGDAAVNAYYKLLNCGFRIGLAAGTDYPCNGGDPPGTLLTYVQINGGQFEYRKWIDGIKNGNTVISRNGHKEFLDMKVNDSCIPGNVIRIKDTGTVKVNLKWTTKESLTGRIELIQNGNVVAVKAGTAKPEAPLVLQTKQFFMQSGWLCARVMGNNGHKLHTSAVYVTVNNLPVRASVADASFFIDWIDNILIKIAPGGKWNRYFTHDLDSVEKRYFKAKEIYEIIANEAQNIQK
jgi:hypothetical protein